jgi:hypothetical protein
VTIYTSAKALSRWPINDESTLTPCNIPISLNQSCVDVLFAGVHEGIFDVIEMVQIYMYW